MLWYYLKSSKKIMPKLVFRLKILLLLLLLFYYYYYCNIFRHRPRRHRRDTVTLGGLCHHGIQWTGIVGPARMPAQIWGGGVEARGCIRWPRILMTPVLSVSYTGSSRCRVMRVSIIVTRARTQHKISWFTFLDRLYLNNGQIWAEMQIYIGATLINF